MSSFNYFFTKETLSRACLLCATLSLQPSSPHIVKLNMSAKFTAPYQIAKYVFETNQFYCRENPNTDFQGEIGFLVSRQVGAQFKAKNHSFTSYTPHKISNTTIRVKENLNFVWISYYSMQIQLHRYYIFIHASLYATRRKYELKYILHWQS